MHRNTSNPCRYPGVGPIVIPLDRMVTLKPKRVNQGHIAGKWWHCSMYPATGLRSLLPSPGGVTYYMWAGVRYWGMRQGTGGSGGKTGFSR